MQIDNKELSVKIVNEELLVKIVNKELLMEIVNKELLVKIVNQKLFVKMVNEELFLKIVNEFKLLTIFSKSFITELMIVNLTNLLYKTKCSIPGMIITLLHPLAVFIFFLLAIYQKPIPERKTNILVKKITKHY